MADVAAELDTTNRAETSLEITRRKERYASAGEKAISALTDWRDATTSAVEASPDLRALEILLGSLVENDLRSVLSAGTQWLADHARMIIYNPGMPALLPKAAPAPVKAKPTVKVPTSSAFVLNPTAYVDAQTGERCRAARGSDIYLTPAQLESGARLGLVMAYNVQDPRVKEHGSQNAAPPPWAHCRDLLTGEMAAPMIQDLPSRKPKHSTFDPSAAKGRLRHDRIETAWLRGSGGIVLFIRWRVGAERRGESWSAATRRDAGAIGLLSKATRLLGRLGSPAGGIGSGGIRSAARARGWATKVVNASAGGRRRRSAHDSPRSRFGSGGISMRPNKPVGINTTVTTNNIPSAKSQ
jgi:hypothetical protein